MTAIADSVRVHGVQSNGSVLLSVPIEDVDRVLTVLERSKAGRKE